MKSRFAFTVLIALISAAAIADGFDHFKYSDADLWETSDLIALIRIENGTYMEDIGFELDVKLLVVLKGNSSGSVRVAAHWPLLYAPSELGSLYLVFLTETGDAQYKLINENRSSVPMFYYEPDEDIADRINALRESNDQDWYTYDRSLWVVDCWQLPKTHPMSEHCVRERSVVEYSMNRFGGVKGQ